MLALILMLVTGCASDIAIITRQDKQQDTSPPDSQTDPSDPDDTNEPNDGITDLTIGFAEISLTQIACPACMGASSEFDIYANLKLHQPTDGGYTEELTPVGTCSTQQLESYVSSSPLDIQGLASFNSIQLYPSGPAQWASSNLAEYQIPRREMITVVTEDGIIPNAFETLEGFDDVQPWELRYVDPSYAFAAVVSKSGTTFTWDPVISDAQFEVLVAVYSPDGSQLLGLVSCMQNDVGYLTIPGTYFQPYPTWSLTAIYLTRHRLERTAALEFNGYLESHQTWTVLGTGHIE